MTTIDVRPADRRGNYTAALAGRDLCTSRQPFLDAARVLLSEGLAPETTLVMRWAASGTESLRAPVRVAAKLTVKEPDRGRAYFAKWEPFAASPVAPPIASNDSPATPLAEAAE